MFGLTNSDIFWFSFFFFHFKEEIIFVLLLLKYDVFSPVINLIKIYLINKFSKKGVNLL